MLREIIASLREDEVIYGEYMETIDKRRMNNEG